MLPSNVSSLQKLEKGLLHGKEVGATKNRKDNFKNRGDLTWHFRSEEGVNLSK